LLHPQNCFLIEPISEINDQGYHTIDLCIKTNLNMREKNSAFQIVSVNKGTFIYIFSRTDSMVYNICEC